MPASDPTGRASDASQRHVGVRSPIAPLTCTVAAVDPRDARGLTAHLRGYYQAQAADERRAGSPAPRGEG
jgi:hypothetical protein